MNRLGGTALAVLVIAGLGMGGCKSQVGSQMESMPAQPLPTYPESRRNEQREVGGRQRRGGRAQVDAAPGVFDFYLLTLSWSPEFCMTHPTAAECTSRPGFVLHGLWPQNFDGTYPEDCSEAPGPAQPHKFSDILPDAHLLEHEWQTHGTCSGMSPDAYFSAARQAVRSVKIPGELASVQSEMQLTPQQILGDFAQTNPGITSQSFALSCGNNRLTAVEVCLGKDLKAIACSGVHSCRANVVKVTPPGATGNE